MAGKVLQPTHGRVRSVSVGVLMLAASLSLLWPAAGGAADEKFALKGDAGAGRVPYKQFCISCHGKKGTGNGPAAGGLNPKPGDFTDPVRMGKLNDEQLYRTIRDGGAAVGKSPIMTAWKAAMTDQQIRDVAAYVKSFNKKKK